MPRGQRKRGAFDFTIWFADGSRYRITSKAGRVLTNQEILDAVRRNLLTPLVNATLVQARAAVGLSVDGRTAAATGEKKSSSSSEN